MIEVQKLIPKVYNQSRDFSVFLGALQVVLNELDQQSRVLEELPVEDLLPRDLANYPKIRSNFRRILKNKGTNVAILYALSLCGDQTYSFDDEQRYLEEIPVDDPTYIDRTLQDDGSIAENPDIDPGRLVYYDKRVNGVYQMFVNIKDLSEVDQGLMNRLFYYLKPVNCQVFLTQATIVED